MRPGPGWAIGVALASMAASLGVGLWNRSGVDGPGVYLDTEREAYVTGGTGRGDLRSVTLHQDTRPGLLNSDQLTALGFRRRHHGAPLARPAFVVLERDTLLTVVDVGPDAGPLERQYPDRNRFLVVRGLVNAYYYQSSPRADGSVRSLLPPRLYLPPGRGRDGPFRLHSGRLHYPFVTDNRSKPVEGGRR